MDYIGYSLFKFSVFIAFLLSTFFLARKISFKWGGIFLFLNPVLLLVVFYFSYGGIDMISLILVVLSFVFSGWISWKNYIFPFETLKRAVKSFIDENIKTHGKVSDVERDSSDTSRGNSDTIKIVKFFETLESEDLPDEMKDMCKVMRLYAEKLEDEKTKVDRMNKMYLYLTNFARYSFSETDKEKLLKEIGNFIEYVIPEKQILLWSEELQKFIKGDQMSFSDIERIKMGKMEDEKHGFVAFPIPKNGDNYAFIIIKGGKIDPHERTFVYLVSKFAESVLKRIDRENEIQLKAITDPLTGIYNRRYFITRLDQQFSKYKRFKKGYSIIIFDIDNFKRINDRYGHFIGDEVLKGFSNVLKEGVRGYDIPARFGGDEFVILLEEVPKDDAVKVAKRIAKKFSDLKELKGMIEEGISVSWGVASIEEADSSYDEILKLADKRLFKAKSLGKGVGAWE